MNNAPGVRAGKPTKADQRRRRIFRALHDCILAQGYVRTTLAEVASSAGMSPSHLLYYFRGKDDILEQYFQLVSERFCARLDSFRRALLHEQIDQLADFWFRGETSTRQEIGFMLECFGAAVHDDVLKHTKAEFDGHCKTHLAEIFDRAERRLVDDSRDSAELAYAMMIGLRSAVYFDDSVDLEDAHRLFRSSMRRMCGLD
jgi:AcrR family transcriptional regulator